MKLRVLSTVLAALLLVGALTGALSASALWVSRELPLGNVDEDESVSTTDARLVLQYCAGKINEEELSLKLANVDADEGVTTSDARLILQYCADKIEQFPGAPLYERTYSEAETTPNENPETFATCKSGNPLLTSNFTADPSAHVWKDGRLYLYPSHDNYPARGCDLMDNYHVYSTDNMVDWVDHGEIFSSADVTWSNCDGFMWAPDCGYIEKTDTYYYFFPHPITNDKIQNKDGNMTDGWNATWAMGVARSVGSPYGPFEIIGYVKLDESLEATPGVYDTDSRTTGYFDASRYANFTRKDGSKLNTSGNAIGGYSLIDPCVFVDDDDTVYLVYGGGGHCFIVELGEDMLTATTLPIELTRPLSAYHEGPWMFKKDGYYFLMYAADSDRQDTGNNRLCYAWSESPTGPFHYAGTALTATNCDTSHGSICEYKGQWYLFYHDATLSGGVTNLRNVCVDKLFFDEEIGLIIQTVEQTKEGVEAVGPAAVGAFEQHYYLDAAPYTGDTAAYSILDAELAGGAKLNNAKTDIRNLHLPGAYATFNGVAGNGKKALLRITYTANDMNHLTVAVTTKGGEERRYGLYAPRTRNDGSTGEILYEILLDEGAENAITLVSTEGAGVRVTGLSVTQLP